MNTITMDTAAFFENLSALIESGVTFEASESCGETTVTFTGGY